MRRKVKGIITLEATIVVPFILVMSMLFVLLMSREIRNNLNVANAQKIVTSAYDFRLVPLKIDEGKDGALPEFISIPVISHLSRNYDRYACKLELSGET